MEQTPRKKTGAECHKSELNLITMLEKLKTSLVPALIHALYSLFYLVCVLPFMLWAKAVERLAVQRQSGALQVTNINSPWPFLSFIKRLLFEFLFDLVAFLSYFVGIVLAIKTFIQMIRSDWFTFGDAFKAFLGVLVITYFVPVIVSLTRDFFQILLLPIRKFISWARKPAQYLDLNMTKQA